MSTSITARLAVSMPTVPETLARYSQIQRLIDKSKAAAGRATSAILSGNYRRFKYWDRSARRQGGKALKQLQRRMIANMRTEFL
jgi:hypothetical protein